MGQHCYISTLRDVFASQLFALLRLVHKHTLYVTTRLYSTRKHIKQKKFFILAHASFAQWSHDAL